MKIEDALLIALRQWKMHYEGYQSDDDTGSITTDSNAEARLYQECAKAYEQNQAK